MDKLREKILFIEKRGLKKNTFIKDNQTALYNIDNFDQIRSLKS
jgi:hypothetical protein